MAANFNLPKIYPITDSRLSGASHSEQLRLLIDGGASFLQIRDKVASSLEFFSETEKCLEVAGASGARLIVNDRVDIALALEADGVHLGRDDLPPTQARAILGKGAIVGFSTHTLEQASAACELPIDYLAYGPIFATRTKGDHETPVGLRGLEIVRKAIGNMPLVAIGGIGIDNVADVLSAGADSAALISALVSDKEKIVERTRLALDTVTNV